MGNLIDFAKCIEDMLDNSGCELHWEPDEVAQYMEEVGLRRQKFEEASIQLNDEVIQPRLETVASYFSNANLTSNEPAGHCSCWFGCCDRFPVNTKVAFAVEHDIRFEKLAVCYDASMMPLFIKFNQHDRLTLQLDEVEYSRVTAWVEERLSEFLEAYLHIDRGGEEFQDEAATDPVCGMRISRTKAVASDAYRGHPYFFCSTECQEKFAREPTLYVKVKTM